MLAIIAILVFVVVALGVFAVASLLDQRSAQARLLRERLATVQEAAARQPSEELALLRDEMLSKIPALDNLLRRSSRISNLQPFLEQANLKIRAGNILMLCVVQRSGPGASLAFLTAWISAAEPGSAVRRRRPGTRRIPSLLVCFLSPHQTFSEIRRVISRGHRYPGPSRARWPRFYHRAGVDRQRTLRAGGLRIPQAL